MSGRPRMPRGLSALEKRAWKSLVSGLEAARELDERDAALIEAAAVEWARAREARALVRKYGLLVPGKGDAVVPNPGLRMEREAWQLFEKFSAQLGLPAAMRARMERRWRS